MALLGNQNLIIKWSGPNPATQAYEKWFIRGIFADGSFYGERRVRFEETFKVLMAKGNLSEQENHETRSLVSEIIEYGLELRLASQSFTGLIAMGKIDIPTIVFRYSEERHQGLEISDKFHRVLEILAPHIVNV